MAKIGVMLAGCGVMDGSEIHEAVLTLLALDRAGAEAVCLAPDVTQRHVVNHLTGAESISLSRNVLVESARIARGAVRPCGEVSAGELDGLIVPGGFGAAKNLCDFALRGPGCEVEPAVAALIKAVHAAGKPIGLLCIAPVIGAKVLGECGLELTIGSDPGTAAAIEEMGARHVVKLTAREIHIDEAHKVVSVPAYMVGKRLGEVAEGIERLVKAVLDMVR